MPGKSPEGRNLAKHSPWGHKEPDMTEQLTHTHFSNLFKELPTWEVRGKIPAYLGGRGVWGRIDTWGGKKKKERLR